MSEEEKSKTKECVYCGGFGYIVIPPDFETEHTCPECENGKIPV